jgi:hypothetical protein
VRKLEVRAGFEHRPAGYGYVGTMEVKVQYLGYVNGLGRFIPIEEEIIPNDVWIQEGAMGAYLGSWRSKFINWIPKARGGHAEDFA